MATIKTVGIKDLKNNLSSYLQDVQRGTRIMVSDRGTVVAEIHEPGAKYSSTGSVDPILAQWIESGIVVLPTRRKVEMKASPVKVEEGAAQRLLDADRDEGHR